MTSQFYKTIYSFTFLLLFIVTDSISQTGVIVWPGDANKDGIVNSKDLLPIGLSYEQLGPPRALPGIDFVPSPAIPWGNQLPVSGIDLANVDMNGDGFINDFDVLAIDSNYGMMHNDTVPVIMDTLNLAGLAAVLCANIPDTAYSGDSVMISISLESPGFPFLPDTVYGISFTFNYDINFTQDSLTMVEIPPASWLGDTSNSLNFAIIRDTSLAFKKQGVVEEIGKIDISIVRKDLANRKGLGEIAVVCIVMDENISPKGPGLVCGNANFSFENVCLISNNEKIIPAQTCSSSMVVCGPPVPCDSATGLETQLINTKKAYLGWSGNGLETSFEIQGGIVGSNDTSTLIVDGGSNFTQVGSLLPSADYWWQIRGQCASLSSSWSSKDTFNTQCNSPDQIGLQSPPTSTSAILEWSEAENAVSYEVLGRKLGSTPLYRFNTPDLSFIAQDLQPATTYEWSVISVCSGSGLYKSSVDSIKFFTTQSSSSKNDLILFPNPAKDFLRISLPYEIEGQEITIQISDIAGRTYYNKQLNASNLIEIPVSDLSTGYYVLIADGLSFSFRKRVLIGF